MPPKIDVTGFTEEQKRLVANAASLGSGVQISNSTPSTSVDNITTPPQPFNVPSPYQSPVPDTSFLDTAYQQTQGEKKAQEDVDLSLEALRQFTDKQGTEAARKVELQTAEGLPDFNKQVKEIYDQIRQNNVQAFTGQQIAEDRLAPNFAIQGDQQSFERERAVKNFSLAAQAEALQGNIALAQSRVDAALAAEFEPLKAKIDFQKTLIESNYKKLDGEAKRAADKRLVQLNERERLLEIDRSEKEGVSKVLLAVSQNQAPQSVRMAVSRAKTLNDAINAASSYIQDPKTKYELANLSLDNQIKQANLDKASADALRAGAAYNYIKESKGLGDSPDWSDKNMISALPVSPLTKAVMSGMAKTKELTPTDRSKVIEEMYSVGFNPNSYILGKMQALTQAWAAVPESSKGYIEGLKFWESSTNPDVAAFESARTLLTREIARLFDVGVLSDQDVASYTQAMPSRQDASIDVVLNKAGGIASSATGNKNANVGKRVQLDDGRQAIVGLDGDTLLDPSTGLPIEE